jgi:catechol 2,3-dioxygenase-like lactoylglutathione lyase family enzyme
MDPLISDLLGRYEQGRLSRRELVAGLSALAAAGCATGTSAVAQAAPPVLPSGIDHVSILAADLQRSTEFYTRVFGLTVASEDTENKIVRLASPAATEVVDRPGVGAVIVSLRQEEPYGMVDHWSFRVPNFSADTAREMLSAHGLTAEQNLVYGFHVRDPDGVVVQMA